jgi:hypothetical protein
MQVSSARLHHAHRFLQTQNPSHERHGAKPRFPSAFQAVDELTPTLHSQVEYTKALEYPRVVQSPRETCIPVSYEAHQHSIRCAQPHTIFSPRESCGEPAILKASYDRCSHSAPHTHAYPSPRDLSDGGAPLAAEYRTRYVPVVASACTAPMLLSLATWALSSNWTLVFKPRLPARTVLVCRCFTHSLR